MSDINHANVANYNYHHYFFYSDDVSICGYRATQVYLCVSRGDVLKVHQQPILDICVALSINNI